MSDAAPYELARRRPHTPPMASPFLEFDLMAEVEVKVRKALGIGGPELTVIEGGMEPQPKKASK